jgi:hypothetical protein
MARSRQQKRRKGFDAHANREICRTPDQIDGAECDQQQRCATRLVERRLRVRRTDGFRLGDCGDRHWAGLRRNVRFILRKSQRKKNNVDARRSHVQRHIGARFDQPRTAKRYVGSLHKMNSGSELVYPERIVKVRGGRLGGPCRPRSGMAKYYDHVFDLRTLALLSNS